MELTRNIFHRDFIELSSDEEDFKEEPLKDVENEIFISFSDQKKHEESHYHSRKRKRRNRKSIVLHECKKKLNDYRNERKCRNQEDDHYLGKNSENINRYTCLCWDDYVCTERKICLKSYKFVYRSRIRFYEYQSPIFQQTDNFISTSVRHGTYNTFQRCI